MTVPGEIPGFGKGVMPPNLTEAESFLDEVDDVSRLIEGLHSGKISPEYVDKKIKQRDAEESRAAEATKAAEDEAERKKYENLPDEKKLEVKQKVDDMIREKERREKARELYAAYRASLPEEELERRSRSTDYSAWDLWTLFRRRGRSVDAVHAERPRVQGYGGGHRQAPRASRGATPDGVSQTRGGKRRV